MINLKLAIILPALILALFSCSKEDSDPMDQPIVMAADNSWTDGSISAGVVQWYRVMADPTFTTLYVEWAEADFHGSSKSYMADIKVSAYMLDGETPYFEEKNNGYGEQARRFDLENEHEVLLKVELNDESRPGTFALRSTGTSSAGEIDYVSLTLGADWKKDTLMAGELLGYIVDCGSAERVSIIWAEAGSPEDGYTAEVMGSVFHLDGETPYEDLDKGKDFLNKNNSHSDDFKSIQVDPAEKSIKIHMAVNSAPGSFAIKVLPFE